MLDEQKTNNAKALMSNNIGQLQEAVSALAMNWAQNQSAESLAPKFEDIAVSLAGIMQMVGLLGYVEVVEQGSDPLES